MSRQSKLPKSGGPSGSSKRKTAQQRYAEYGKYLEENASALVEKAVDLALDGNIVMLKICLERLLPSLRSVDTTHELGDNFSSLLNHIHGRIGPPNQFKHGITIEGQPEEKVGEWTLPSLEAPKEPVNGGSA